MKKKLCAILLLFSFLPFASGIIWIQPARFTTAGGGGASTLDDFANLVAWYKTPISGATDGNAISSWPDSKGSYNYTASGTAPTYQTSEINSLDAVEFVSKQLDVGGYSASTLPTTAVIVAKFTTTFDYQTLLGASSGDGGLLIQVTPTDKIRIEKANLANIGTTTSNVAASGNWQVVIVVVTATTWQVWVDGSSIGSGSHSETLTGGRTFTMGGDKAGGAYYWNDKIAEVGIYSTDKTSDVAAITSAMNTKYGL